jgi:hypothetical protein
MTEECSGGTDQLVHNRYGRFDNHPRTEVEMSFAEWNEAAKQALEYKLGPPIAWEYDEGALYLWGEWLNDTMLNRIADACRQIEREHADMAIYEAAETARRAASKISRAEVRAQDPDTDRIDPREEDSDD